MGVIPTTLEARLVDLRGNHDPVTVTMPDPYGMQRDEWDALWVRNLATLAQLAIQWRDGSLTPPTEDFDLESAVVLARDILTIAAGGDPRSRAYGGDITFHIARVPVTE